MKKIILFITLAMAAVSCSDDNNATVQNNSDAIVGKWELQELLVDNAALDLNTCDYGTYKEFKADGTLQEHYKCGTVEYVDNSTYTISGNNVTTTLTQPGQDNPEYTFQVIELTSEVLITTSTYQDEDNINHVNKSTFMKIQ